MAYNFPGVPAAAMPPMGMLKRPNHIFYINHFMSFIEICIFHCYI